MMFGPGIRMSSDRSDQQQAVNDKPHAMAFVIALKRPPDQRMCLFEGQILRMKGDDRRLAPEVPQQALLGDTLGDPRHDPLLQAPEPAAGA